MPELIEQRVMLVPGAGIARPEAPTQQHNEYPKHMVHPGFQPGTVGQEVKSPHGFSYYVGGTSIRFPPVLVMDADQEARHEADGYVSIGKSDPGAFSRAVAEARPPSLDHTPIEYPKWVQGKLVHSAGEEAELTGEPPRSSEAASDAPAVDAEVNTLEVFPAAVETKEDRIARLRRELAALEGASPGDTTTDGLIAPPLVPGLVEAVAARADDAPIEFISAEGAVAPLTSETVLREMSAEEKKKAHGDAVRAGIARKKMQAANEAA